MWNFSLQKHINTVDALNLPHNALTTLTKFIAQWRNIQ